MEYYLAIREQNLTIYDNTNGPRGYYAKRKRTYISLLFQQSLHFIQSSNVLIKPYFPASYLHTAKGKWTFTTGYHEKSG